MQPRHAEQSRPRKHAAHKRHDRSYSCGHQERPIRSSEASRYRADASPQQDDTAERTGDGGDDADSRYSRHRYDLTVGIGRCRTRHDSPSRRSYLDEAGERLECSSGSRPTASWQCFHDHAALVLHQT
jgi:hypothetical protein